VSSFDLRRRREQLSVTSFSWHYDVISSSHTSALVILQRTGEYGAFPIVYRLLQLTNWTAQFARIIHPKVNRTALLTKFNLGR